MDLCMVNIGAKSGIKIGDEVVLIGRQGKSVITAEDVAEKCRTISYEVVCGINKGIKRNESIYKLMKLMYIKGYKIYIVSTSSKYVVEWAFKRFFSNISANVIGIENIIKNRILTDELVYPLSVYGGKVENIKNKISGNEKPILAVGDSIGDEKMLEYSQVKIVVDRNNQLTKIAKDKGWIVLLQR